MRNPKINYPTDQNSPSSDPFEILHRRFMSKKISSKKYEKMEKFLEKNIASKIDESDSDFFDNLHATVLSYVLSEIDEKEFKNRKKILEKHEKKRQKGEYKKWKNEEKQSGAGRRHSGFERKKMETPPLIHDDPPRDSVEHQEEDKIKCQNCGFMDSGNFCSKCGKPLEHKITCPKCGFLGDGNFCSKCGASLQNSSNNNDLGSDRQSEKKKGE